MKPIYLRKKLFFVHKQVFEMIKLIILLKNIFKAFTSCNNTVL